MPKNLILPPILQTKKGTPVATSIQDVITITRESEFWNIRYNGELIASIVDKGAVELGPRVAAGAAQIISSLEGIRHIDIQGPPAEVERFRKIVQSTPVRKIRQ